MRVRKIWTTKELFVHIPSDTRCSCMSKSISRSRHACALVGTLVRDNWIVAKLKQKCFQFFGQCFCALLHRLCVSIPQVQHAHTVTHGHGVFIAQAVHTHLKVAQRKEHLSKSWHEVYNKFWAHPPRNAHSRESRLFQKCALLRFPQLLTLAIL